MRYLLGVLFCLLIPVQAMAGHTLLLGSGEWPPYTQEAPGDHGIATEIVEAVVQEMGMETHIQWLPWKRNELLLKQGAIFASFPYRQTLERSRVFEFSDPLLYTTTRLFYDHTRVAPVVFEKFSDLQNVSVGGVRGYGYVEDFKSVGADLTEVSYDSQLVQMLASRRIDFAAMDSLGGRLLLTDILGDKQQDYSTLARPLNKKSASRLMVSRDYPGYKTLLENFNAALGRIKEKGLLQKIYDKYQYSEP